VGSAAALLLGLLPPGAFGQFRRSPQPIVASGSVTLVATLETLAVSAAPIDIGAPPPAAAHSGLQSYVITTRAAMEGHRTTVFLKCLVPGTTPGAPAYEVLLPSAAARSQTSQPVTRTDFLNIRMDNGAPPSGQPDSPAQQLSIIAQAL
jgi:hypothetical protein